jgi:hypothetical protein
MKAQSHPSNPGFAFHPIGRRRKRFFSALHANPNLVSMPARKEPYPGRTTFGSTRRNAQVASSVKRLALMGEYRGRTQNIFRFSAIPVMGNFSAFNGVLRKQSSG